jgi:hypothetical protein
LGLLGGCSGGDAIAAEPQQLGQPGGGPEGGIQDHVAIGAAGSGSVAANPVTTPMARAVR